MFCAAEVGVMTIGNKAEKRGWKDTDQKSPSGGVQACFATQ